MGALSDYRADTAMRVAKLLGMLIRVSATQPHPHPLYLTGIHCHNGAL